MKKWVLSALTVLTLTAMVAGCSVTVKNNEYNPSSIVKVSEGKGIRVYTTQVEGKTFVIVQRSSGIAVAPLNDKSN